MPVLVDPQKNGIAFMEVKTTLAWNDDLEKKNDLRYTVT
jgi:hypothetical protein